MDDHEEKLQHQGTVRTLFRIISVTKYFKQQVCNNAYFLTKVPIYINLNNNVACTKAIKQILISISCMVN